MTAFTIDRFGAAPAPLAGENGTGAFLLASAA